MNQKLKDLHQSLFELQYRTHVPIIREGGYVRLDVDKMKKLNAQNYALKHEIEIEEANTCALPLHL